MPAERNTKQSRRLTAAGLIAVTAATLLMMAWAIFPTAAFADVPWDGNGVVNGHFKDERCDAQNTPYIFWVFTGDPAQGETVVHLTVNNGAPITMVQQGQGSWHATSPFFDLATLTASVDGVGGNLTISHGCPGETTTSTSTTPTSTSTTATSTSTTATTTSTTATSTSTTATTTSTTATSTTTTTPTTTTTTTPGGGGGGGTTATTPPASTTPTTTAIVAPTTVHNTSTTVTAEVLPTTVRPGKLAFTGIEDVVPIGALALTLMTTGSGLLWAGSRRRRQDGSEDED
jgi:hypothetical protein